MATLRNNLNPAVTLKCDSSRVYRPLPVNITPLTEDRPSELTTCKLHIYAYTAFTLVFLS